MLNFQLDMMELQKKDGLDDMFVQARSAIDDKAQRPPRASSTHGLISLGPDSS